MPKKITKNFTKIVILNWPLIDKFGQMSQGTEVPKFLVGGISKGMGFENPQDVSVLPRDVTKEEGEARCE